jgi:probable rRNA maturation factor
MKRRRGARSPAWPRGGVTEIDIVVASTLWTEQRSVKAPLRRAIREAASVTSTAVGEIAIVLTDDSAIRALNRDWRGKDAATNVLSFPAGEPRGTRGIPRLLGDIVIAYETTEREARAEHKPFMHHLMHLAVHGFLHLAGYDHAADDQAAAMERLEAAILARLGVPDPYLARGAA